ncbi:hypothetical protein C0584_02660 [Candidatus Parcubacteria bacterium]|nr:MAG: hypothetical protein C0584_02660 [Candidatus Parcubacteria bacterium]
MWRQKQKNNFISTFSIGLFLLVWEVAGRFEIINPIFISFPTRVLWTGFSLIASGDLWSHLMISIIALFSGLLLAVVFGLIIGMSAGYKEYIFDFIKPYIYGLNSLPKVALIPLIIIWLGIGISAKIIVIFIMALPSIAISVIEGVKNTEEDLIEMTFSFGGSKFNLLRSIVYYESLPFFFSGLKIAVGKAIIGLVIADMFGYGLGLGYLLTYYGATFKVANLMFIILLLLSISLILNMFIDYFSKKMVYWKNNKTN